MQTPLQQPRPEMPEAYSDSFDNASQHEEYLALAGEHPPSPEVSAHAGYITRLTRGQVEVEGPLVERQSRHAFSARDFAQILSDLGDEIIKARQSEVERDLGQRND